VLSAQAAVLTKGVLHAMWITKMKTAALALVSAALIGGGSTVTYQRLAAGEADPSADDPAPQVPGARDEPPRQGRLGPTAEDLKKQLDEAHKRAAVLEEQLADSNERLKKMADRMDLLEKALRTSKDPNQNSSNPFIPVQGPGKKPDQAAAPVERKDSS